MNSQKKQQLLSKVKDVQEQLNFVEDGQHGIGSLCIAVEQLADVVIDVIKEIDDIDTVLRRNLPE